MTWLEADGPAWGSFTRLRDLSADLTRPDPDLTGGQRAEATADLTTQAMVCAAAAPAGSGVRTAHASACFGRSRGHVSTEGVSAQIRQGLFVAFTP